MFFENSKLHNVLPGVPKFDKIFVSSDKPDAWVSRGETLIPIKLRCRKATGQTRKIFASQKTMRDIPKKDGWKLVYPGKAFHIYCKRFSFDLLSNRFNFKISLRP